MRILYVKRRLMSFAAADSVCLSVVSVSYENCISIVGVMLAERQTKKTGAETAPVRCTAMCSGLFYIAIVYVTHTFLGLYF